ncbi:MAG: LytTR family DNA-binding domain-containing protein [Bacteroidota bacterium]
MVKCLIIDDELPARNLMANFVDQLPGFEVVASIDNALDGFVFLQQNTVDLLFLDVHMPQMSGLELVKSLSNKPQIILTTAFREYAVDGFDLGVFDYLVKPISQERFLKTVDRYLQYINSGKSHQDPILLKVGKETKKFDPDQIYYFEGLKDYIKVYSTEGTFVIYERMGNMESILPTSLFSRIHKSFIVSNQHISQRGSNQVIVHGQSLPIGRTYRQEFLDKISNN